MEATGQVVPVNEGVMDEDYDDEEGPRPPLLPMAGLFYGVMFAAALAWGAIEGRAPVFAPDADEVEWLPDLGLGLGVGLAVVLVSEAVTRLTSWGERTAQVLGEMLGPVSAQEAVWLALASALAEELLFRGAMQPHLGWVLTSVLFGLAHMAPRRDLMPWTLMAVAAGFLLGGLFEYTGNVLAPIAAHFVVNAINLRQLSKRYGEGSTAQGPED